MIGGGGGSVGAGGGGDLGLGTGGGSSAGGGLGLGDYIYITCLSQLEFKTILCTYILICIPGGGSSGGGLGLGIQIFIMTDKIRFRSISRFLNHDFNQCWQTNSADWL